MRVLLSWLRELAPLEGDPDALADTMSALGLAVEEVERVGAPVDGVIVAEVLALRAHPQADRIQLVDVDTGDGQPLQICCGAFNMAVGDRVPLATLGTTMPGGLEIARRKLRGEWSNGMLCSPTELGLGDDPGGILVLPSDLPLGAPVFDALGVSSDVVFDLDLTRNRPDAYSHRGVARDVAAFTGVPFTDDRRPCRAVGPSRHDAGRARRPRGLRALHGHGPHGCRGAAVGTVDGRAAPPRRHEADQQRRRCLQLRHARAGPAQPPVRPRPPPRWRLPGPARRCRRDA